MEDTIINLGKMPYEEAVRWVMQNYGFNRDEAEREVLLERDESEWNKEMEEDGKVTILI